MEEELNFLDMVSTDMNFEQAYNMYNNLQQENAINQIENLQKIQSMTLFPLDNKQEVPKIEDDFQSVKESKKNDGDEEEGDDGDDGDEVDDEENSDNEFDKFFTNTESTALEKFLDNLANPKSSNPLELYNNNNYSNYSNYNYQFNFKPKPEVFKDYKNDFSAFSHPPETQNHNNINNKHINNSHISHINNHNINGNLIGKDNLLTTPPQQIPHQLPTPESRQPSIDDSLDDPNNMYSNYNGMNGEPYYKKRKRSTSKPLLSLEQKRLNHSFSEQKRRQLCKLAYERCLRLITNFDNYCKNPPINKKLKRKQFNKDGLPNLSKFCALNKISNEIIKIKNKNDEMKKLLSL